MMRQQQQAEGLRILQDSLARVSRRLKLFNTTNDENTRFMLQYLHTG